MTPHALAEADLQQRVIDLARLRGWRVCAFRPARTAKGWMTPVQGDPGVPDLVLARAGTVLLAELKAASGRVTAEQWAWLEAAGPCGRLWRPADWDSITREIAA